jgi:hypothetical protein
VPLNNRKKNGGRFGSVAEINIANYAFIVNEIIAITATSTSGVSAAENRRDQSPGLHDPRRQISLLTSRPSVGIHANMKVAAALLLRERHQLAENAFVEMRVWRVPKAVRGSAHRLKYSLACVVNGACVVRYDNEAGKGDHRHIGDREEPYRFASVDRLLFDFWKDVDQWLTSGQ